MSRYLNLSPEAKERFKCREVERTRKRRERNRQYIVDWLSTHPCLDCEEADPVVLQFDHLRDKGRYIVTHYVNCSQKRLQEEIDKCEVVCANCHVRRTADRHGNWFKSKLLPKQVTARVDIS